MNKIVWSGRSHTYNKSEIRYLTNIIKSADPLTNGNELKFLKKITKIS